MQSSRTTPNNFHSSNHSNFRHAGSVTEPSFLPQGQKLKCRAVSDEVTRGNERPPTHGGPQRVWSLMWVFDCGLQGDGILTTFFWGLPYQLRPTPVPRARFAHGTERTRCSSELVSFALVSPMICSTRPTVSRGQLTVEPNRLPVLSLSRLLFRCPGSALSSPPWLL